jgi:O-antigen/teichoic acid export membrane protein
MLLFRVVERLIGLVSTLILVRLLVPADFGLVAMATSIIAVVEVMGAFGFDTVLIHRQNATTDHYNTAWTFNVIVASGIALALLALAVPAASFYGEPRLTAVVALLAFASWVAGFENIGVVDFRKSLQFDKEFRYLMIKRLLGFATVVPLAFILKSYWALVIGTLVGKCGLVVASFFVHPYRPRLSLAARHELFNFSKWLLLNNLILLARDRSADFTIGRLLGPHSLGLYSVSNEVASLPQHLSAPANRAIFPAYAKQAADLEQLRRTFVQVTSFLWAIAVPAGVGIALIAPVLVPVVLGDRWLDAIPILTVLALAGTFMVMQDNVGYVFYALGAPRITTFLTFTYVAMMLPLLLWLAARYGPVGAASAHLATAAVFVPICFGVALHRLRLSPLQLARAVWRIILATAVMAASVHEALKWLTAKSVAAPWALAACVAVGMITYAASLVALWLLAGRPDGAERVLWQQLRQRALRFPAAGAAVAESRD